MRSVTLAMALASCGLMALPACRSRLFNPQPSAGLSDARQTPASAADCSATVGKLSELQRGAETAFASGATTAEQVTTWHLELGRLPACNSLAGGWQVYTALMAFEDAFQQRAQNALQDETQRTHALRLWNTAYEVRLILAQSLAEKAASALLSTNGQMSPVAVRAAELYADLGVEIFTVDIMNFFRDKATPEMRKVLLNMAAEVCTPTYQSFLWQLATHSQPVTDAFEPLARCGAPDATPEADDSGKIPGLHPKWMPAWLGKVATPSEFDTLWRLRREGRERMKDTLAAALQRAKMPAPEAKVFVERLFPARDGRLRGDRVGFHRGFEVKEGDIILMQNGPTGAFWEQMTTSPVNLSHLGVVTFSDDGEPLLIEQGETAINVTQLNVRMSMQADYIILRREGLSELQRMQLARLSSQYFSDKRYAYDYRFDLEDASRNYCVEFGYHLYNKAGLEQRWALFSPRNAQVSSNLGVLGIHTPKFAGLGMFISTPGFKVVGRVYNFYSQFRSLSAIVSEQFVRRMAKDTFDPQQIDGFMKKFLLTELGRFLNYKNLHAAGRLFPVTYVSLSERLSALQDTIEEPLVKKSGFWRDFSRFTEENAVAAEKAAPAVDAEFSSLFR